MDIRLVFAGMIVIIIGIIRSLVPGEIPRFGLHPLNLINTVSGYVIVVLGILIVFVAIGVKFIINRKDQVACRMSLHPFS